LTTESARGTVVLMRAPCVPWLALLVLAAPACGSGNGASPFMPTTPVADVCSMLALGDVQTLLPGATAGMPLAPEDDADAWTRGCAWDGSGGLAISLLVEGALTSKGKVVLGTLVDVTGTSTQQATPVAGVGDKAAYLVNEGLDQILNALQGSILVSLAAYNFMPGASEASLEPLVVEALGKL
jgi:hypothetical protein